MLRTPARTLLILGLTALSVGAAHASEPKPADDGRTGDEMWQDWCATQQPFRTFKPKNVLTAGSYPSRHSYIVCADATGDSVMTGPSTWNRIHFPLPHSAILLVVRSDSPVAWRLTQGTRGWTAAGIDGNAAPAATDAEPTDEGTAGTIADVEAAAIVAEAADLLPNDPGITVVNEYAQRGPVDQATVRGALEGARNSAGAEQTRVDELIEQTYRAVATSVVNLHRFQPGEVGIELSIDPTTPRGLAAHVDTLRAHAGTLAAALEQAANAAKQGADDEELGDAWSGVESALRSARADLVAASDRLDKANDLLEDRSAVERASALAQQALVDGLYRDVSAEAATVRLYADAQAPPATEDSISSIATITQTIDAIASAIAAIPDPQEIVLPTLIVEPAYTGAIKVGVGVAWVPMYADFDVGQANVAGSDGLRVVQQTGGGPLALDATLAYSHYLSRRPASNPGLRASFTGGVAIASVTEQKVSALDMIYFGVEYGAPNLSGAVVLQARTTEILQDELSVGAPVDGAADADSIVRKGVTVGVGVIFHPAPVLASVGGKKS
jgi:hypothetical protein